MNVTLIEPTPIEASQKAEEYERAVEAGHDLPGDAELAAAYRAAASGKPLIDLWEALANAGVDDLGRPRLAITRAHCSFCWCGHGSNGLRSRLFAGGETRQEASRYKRSKHAILCTPALFACPQERDCIAAVPSIPPQYRPLVPRGKYAGQPLDLRHLHILWEAEWQAMPVDPMLLRHVAGSLYAVLAQWDLTPLEQAVLKNQRTS